MNTSEEKKVPHDDTNWEEINQKLKEFNDTQPYRFEWESDFSKLQFSLSGLAVIEPFSRHVIYRPYS